MPRLVHLPQVNVVVVSVHLSKFPYTRIFPKTDAQTSKLRRGRQRATSIFSTSRRGRQRDTSFFSSLSSKSRASLRCCSKYVRIVHQLPPENPVSSASAAASYARALLEYTAVCPSAGNFIRNPNLTFSAFTRNFASSGNFLGNRDLTFSASTRNIITTCWVEQLLRATGNFDLFSLYRNLY